MLSLARKCGDANAAELEEEAKQLLVKVDLVNS